MDVLASVWREDSVDAGSGYREKAPLPRTAEGGVSEHADRRALTFDIHRAAKDNTCQGQHVKQRKRIQRDFQSRLVHVLIRLLLSGSSP